MLTACCTTCGAILGSDGHVKRKGLLAAHWGFAFPGQLVSGYFLSLLCASVYHDIFTCFRVLSPLPGPTAMELAYGRLKMWDPQLEVSPQIILFRELSIVIKAK